jgi:adenosylcobinamide kinase / adenosylcobinamide-phosphate guanylyltransferase
MGKLTFILGGARSGKSTHAQKLAEQSGKSVTFLATATASDDEMAARIAKHQQERPAGWQTREIPCEIARVLKNQAIETELVLLDCLTLLLNNVLFSSETDFDHPDEAAAAEKAETEIQSLLASIAASPANWIVVSNEVGLGLVPPYPLGRLYRDLLGRANQLFAAQADEVLWMVAGIPVPIQQYRQP